MNNGMSNESLSYLWRIKNENFSLPKQAKWATSERKGWMALKSKSEVLRKKDNTICQNIYQDCQKQD